jgi:FkbM family methyltransferase
MDKVFHNYPNVLKYFTPESYLDVGACKGQAIPFILEQLPSLTKVEMIEANEFHREDLEVVSKRYNVPFHIEVLSNEIKEVTFYLDGKGSESTGPGNSYYLEDTHHYINTPSEKRITNTLDNIYNETNLWKDGFDLIKMDTQGSELDIIKGGKELIKKTKGIILEENEFRYNFGAALHSEIKEYMKSIGFELVGLLDDKRRTIQNREGVTINQHEMDTLYIRKDLLT